MKSKGSKYKNEPLKTHLPLGPLTKDLSFYEILNEWETPWFAFQNEVHAFILIVIGLVLVSPLSNSKICSISIAKHDY